jgi:hypothetical protein
MQEEKLVISPQFSPLLTVLCVCVCVCVCVWNKRPAKPLSLFSASHGARCLRRLWRPSLSPATSNFSGRSSPTHVPKAFSLSLSLSLSLSIGRFEKCVLLSLYAMLCVSEKACGRESERLLQFSSVWHFMGRSLNGDRHR